MGLSSDSTLHGRPGKGISIPPKGQGVGRDGGRWDSVWMFPADPLGICPLFPGTHDLKRGSHRLSVEIVGANEKAKKAYMFGLDYLILKPAG